MALVDDPVPWDAMGMALRSSNWWILVDGGDKEIHELLENGWWVAMVDDQVTISGGLMVETVNKAE